MKLFAINLRGISLAVLLATLPVLHAQVRSSASYTLVAETQDGGGAVIAGSASYSLEASVEPLSAGDSTGSNLALEHGFLNTGVVVDTGAPVITLAGDAVMTLYAGTDSYSEPGATASDLVDGLVTVVIGGDAVDASTPGTYLVTYDAIDNEGFAADQVVRTVHVTRPVYFVNAAAPDGGDGASWATAFKTLQDALDLTAPRTREYYGKDQQVWVAAGTYYPDEGAGQSPDDRTSTFLIKTGVSLYGGFSGSENTLDQREPDANLTILSGDLDQDDSGSPGAGNAYHVVTMLDPANYTANKGAIRVDSMLDGFTVTRGKADGAAPHDTGGGLLVTGTVLDDGRVRNCRIHGNAAGNGAGVGVIGSSFLAIDSSEIRDNHAEFDGGGLYVGQANGITRLDVVSLESNTATRGGAFYFNTASLGPWARLEFCRIRGNHATGSGGGIHLGLGSIRIYTCLITGNASDGTGGGIHAEEAVMTFSFCTLAGNRAAAQGGALYGERLAVMLDEWGEPSDPMRLGGTVIWGNADQDGAGAPGGSIAGAVAGVAVFNGSLTEGFAPGGTNLDGTLAANDPRFVAPVAATSAPSANGDYHLTAGSPLIDRALGSGGLDLDLVARGASRDIGAYEYVSAYVLWAADSGLEAGVNDAPDADPNGDGLTNLQHFAFNTNPLGDGQTEGKKRMGLAEVGGVESLTLTLPVRNGAVFSGSSSLTAVVDEITYTVQGTGDLEDWTKRVIEVTPADSDGLPALNTGWEYRSFILEDGTMAQAFLRVALESGL